MNIENEAEERAKFQSALDRGMELFNAGAFVEAYEVWSERWSEETTEGADLLQGLLQVAVGFSKLEDGNPAGTVKLLKTAVDKLGLYAPAAYGIDVDALVALLEGWRVALEAMLAQGSADGVSFPEMPGGRSRDDGSPER